MGMLTVMDDAGSPWQIDCKMQYTWWVSTAFRRSRTPGPAGSGIGRFAAFISLPKSRVSAR